MSDRTEQSTSSLSYTLSCVDCSFEMTVQGGTYDVLDVIDSHQEAHQDDSLRHFVEFESEPTQ